MSHKTPDNISELSKRRAGRVCRVSYTIDNMQPVLCSIIGSEPLFFMDHESDEFDDLAALEETFAEDPFNFDKIEQGLNALEEKINHVTKMVDAMDSPSGNALSAFYENADSITQPTLTDESHDIEELKESLRKSRLGGSYLDFILRHKTKISYSRETADAIYDRGANAILINPDRDMGEQQLLAARELRRVWQHRNGALIHPLMFQPEQSILIHRAQTADLAVNMVRIAWEMQLSGEGAAWERMEKSSMADLAASFAREAALDFRAVNNGSAGSSVFETWFLSERCRHEDRRLIQQMLSDYHGYVFEPSEPSKSMTAELIVALGTMPFGKNYLAPYVTTITNDAVFTEVRDRSNANFLWFIKFERSFRETERDLHGDKSVRHRELPHDGTHINKNGRIGENAKTADIISLPSDNAASSSPAVGTARRTASAGNGGGGGANIISFFPRGPLQ